MYEWEHLTDRPVFRRDGPNIVKAECRYGYHQGRQRKKVFRFGLLHGGEAWGPLYPSICTHSRTYLSLVCSHGLPLCRSLHNSPEILATRIKGVLLQWQPIQAGCTAPQNGDCDFFFVKNREKQCVKTTYLLYIKRSATDRVGRTGIKSDKN